IPNPNRAAPWRPPRGDGRGDACWDLGCGIWDFRAMALLDELKRILEREQLYVQDKFEEWVTLAKTTHQTLDRVLSASGYLTEAQMLRIFGECLGLPVLDRVVEQTVPKEFVDKIPVSFARHHNLIAIGKANGTVRVASCSPLDTHPI